MITIIGYIISFIIGTCIGIIIGVFTFSVGTNNKRHDYYQEGFSDGYEEGLKKK